MNFSKQKVMYVILPILGMLLLFLFSVSKNENFRGRFNFDMGALKKQIDGREKKRNNSFNLNRANRNRVLVPKKLGMHNFRRKNLKPKKAPMIIPRQLKINKRFNQFDLKQNNDKPTFNFNKSLF